MEAARPPQVAAKSRLPGCFKVKHRKLVAALRELLAVPIGERAVTEPDGTAWNDEELVTILANFDQTGGFPTDYNGPRGVFDTVANGRFDREETEFVHRELRKELENGWCEMFLTEEAIPWEKYRTSPIFTTVKKKGGRPKLDALERVKRRLIDHMSYPTGDSLNDYTCLSIPIVFEDVEDASRKTMRLKASGAERVLYWKSDEISAYRQWPIEEKSRKYFGRRWLNPYKPIPQYVLDGAQPREEDLIWLFSSVLPFGFVRSVEWYHRIGRALNALFHFEDCPGVKTRVPTGVHYTSRYLDDTLGICMAEWAAMSKAIFFEMCDEFGIGLSLEKDKEEGALSSVKDFLGLELRADEEEKRVSEQRLADGLARLEEVAGKKYIRTKEPDSLIGVLSFCAMACSPARTYMRRMYDLQTRTRKRRRRPRFVRLDRGCQADIAFWRRAWRTYNGAHMMEEERWRDATTCGCWTDASGGTQGGYGGAFLREDGVLEYFAGEWPYNHGLAINECELATAVFAAGLWGK